MANWLEPSAAREHVGGLIRHCRQQAGMTQRKLATETHVSESLEGAYERGERIPSAGFLIDADRCVVAGGVLESCVALMEKESNRAKFQEWSLLEAEALSLGTYVTMVLPGLLQEPGYIRALYKTRVYPYAPDEAARLVDERLARQAVLVREQPPNATFVVEEVAVKRPLGGSAVLKKALQYLLDAVQAMDHVTLQVMPSVVESHAGLSGPLDMLFSPDGRRSIYLERQRESALLTRPVDAERYADMYSAIRAQALPPWKSLELIEKVAGEL
ncbi:Scr1 family TA system antitoxin-like transcriptional regulator [Streptomyces rimosus]|uniref:helix-turn-helix domain-containing protein n=1 Tax=Streptomyces rimosus TaxID=1927 RepID=UPI00067DC42C|nr:helix-turn-helix transcriptional regulator [Streptomyces rimosus]